MIKLDESFSGEGNAVLRYPESPPREALREALRQVEFSVPTETPEAYFDKFAKMGGIVEEFIEAEEKLSPSAQLRISPRGAVEPISTHDQILGGPSGQVFLGCRFPAHDDYRLCVQDLGQRIGQVLAADGCVSRFGVDFLVHRDQSSQEWKVTALEINLRMGGTTHPYLALQFLTGGQLDAETGLFLSPSGHAKYYKATDNLYSPALPRAAARGPDRDPDGQQAALQPRQRVRRAVPPDRRALGVRQARPHRDRQQPAPRSTSSTPTRSRSSTGRRASADRHRRGPGTVAAPQGRDGSSVVSVRCPLFPFVVRCSVSVSNFPQSPPPPRTREDARSRSQLRAIDPVTSPCSPKAAPRPPPPRSESP